MEQEPVVLINTFTLKPGKLAEFIDVQRAAVPSFAGRVPGLLGSRMHRALDGGKAVLVTLFDTQENWQRFAQSAEFIAHRDKIQALIERADPGFYQVAYQTGAFEDAVAI